MIKIENEKLISKILASDARKYCESVNGEEIYNVAGMGEGEYRIMYWVTEDGKRYMKAVILPIPTE